jgi:hypothetical protein
LVPTAVNSCASSAVSVSSADSGQLSPAAASRRKVNRTVDGATFSRRAISLPETPAALKRSTSRTWRIGILSAGIHPLPVKSRGRTLIAPAEALSDRCLPGRHHPGTASEIISEHQATSNRNGGRYHSGFAGDFTRNQHLIVHNIAAFRPDGLPLGLLDIQCWARDVASFAKKHQRHSTPIAAKESYKWMRPLTAIRAAADQCPNTRIVVTADREADVFEFLHEAHNARLDVLVRAMENRALKADLLRAPLGTAGDEHRLWPYMQSLHAAAQITLEVPRHGRQPARTALIRVRFAEVTLTPPRDKGKLAPLRMWVVRAQEENPSPGVTPLDWMLSTTVPVAGLDEALERIQWYTRRWGIDVFHRILKSGCRIEVANWEPPTVWKPAWPSTWWWRGVSIISLGSGGRPLKCLALYRGLRARAVERHRRHLGLRCRSQFSSNNPRAASAPVRRSSATMRPRRCGCT